MSSIRLFSNSGIYLDIKDHILLEITKKCNYRCKHCFTNAGKPFKPELPLNLLRTLIEDSEKLNFKAITISGGEPTLRKDLIDVLRLFSDSKLKVCLFTNGSRINEKNLREMMKYVDSFAISLDGDEKIHDELRGKKGSFLEVKNAIGLFKKYNLNFLIQFMVTPFSWNKIDWIARFAMENGAKVVRISHISPQGKALRNKKYLLQEEKYPLLYEKISNLNKKYKKILFLTNVVHKKELKKYPDKYKTIALHILPNGLILPWFNLSKKWAIGNLMKDSFVNIMKRFPQDPIFLRIKKLFENSYLEGLNYKYEAVPLEDIVFKLSILP